MHHDFALISTLATAFGAALILGFVAAKLRMPALVGYLVAGMVIGPFTPGVVADTGLASELAEIGVMLLMFGVGLHFSLDDLWAVRKIALPGAVLQIAAATAMGAFAAWFWDWSWGAAIVFGLALSVASTVVLLRALEARGVLESMNGQIAVGWLVVEDLAMVLVLVLLPPLAGALGGNAPEGGVPGAIGTAASGNVWAVLGLTLLKVGAFLALMLVFGRKLLPRLLWWVAQTGSRELFTLATVAFAVGIAFGAAELFGVSFALGAFIAGMVLRESELSHRAANETLPLQDAFAVLFFVSVGMLFDWHVLVDEPMHVIATVAIIVFGKTLVAAAIVLLLRYPLNTALTVSASLAQIGEFSFILAGLGVSLGVLPKEGQGLILAGAIISIAFNPLLFAAVSPITRWMRERSALARQLEQPADPTATLPMSTDPKYLAGHAVLVGYGRVGKRIAQTLSEQGVPVVVVDQNRERVELLRERGFAAVSGDASEPATLVQAHISGARFLVVAIPDTFDVRRMVDTARTINPGIDIVVRSHNAEEAALLAKEGAGHVFLGEVELADGMTDYVLSKGASAKAPAH
ncbi:Kef family K(+) transporter [Lysobacter sp. KIS68-7]|uniref:YbaL family putative K(+) efflux transporter n=1 Tax=Lysobacter sp. KIS68-7 TaxID=2904252 RepID=UPI001E654F18|nr:YbaL family putative K(+) efflux transporter [Lysobacter sp. KIS68-7]UHQ19301.1 Kef family K(+) transporter [Lysobacter sp. KIS68-7]